MRILVGSIIGLACWSIVWGIGSARKSLSSLCTIHTSTRTKSARQHHDDTAQLKPVISTETTINFQSQPNVFVNILTNCFNDDDCRIAYYHFGKSGGTDVVERMQHFAPPRLDSCCNDLMMKRFHDNPEKHCNIKFSSYEVSSTSFLNDILPTCYNITKGRAVVLVTFREPVARTVSYIHQMCNKNLHLRTPQQRQVCERCSYKDDKDYWTNFLQDANKQYQGLYDVASFVPKPYANVVLAIDLVDLSQLYSDLHNVTNHDAFHMKTKANPESTKLCNFGITSEWLRALRPANDVYRNLTLGIYNNQNAQDDEDSGAVVAGMKEEETIKDTPPQDAAPPPSLPESCRPYVKGHTLDLTHGRYIHVPNRKAPYDHNSCFLMKPRYNCATANTAAPKAYEYKFILQSDPTNASSICDIQAVVEGLGGPAAFSNKQVAIFGNSFLRQTFEALACKYQGLLTAAKVTANPPSVSLGALKKRKGKPYTIEEYGTIVNVPVDQRPIPLCAGSSSAYSPYFEDGVNLTTPHLTTACSDELAMLEFGSSLKVFYNFRPDTLQDNLSSYQKMIGLNISQMDYIAFNKGEDKHIQRNSPTKLAMYNYERILPTLQRIQRSDLKMWFGATNPWIKSPPDMHPCLPGVPDDEASLLLFAVLFDIHAFQV